jgi:uncharacterized membrane protein YhaH (DUF805 family)
MNWYLDVIKKYAVFTGRARRKEYWMYTLFYVIGFVVLSILEGVVGLPGVLSSVYSLGLLLPSIGVGIRRLHDINRTGWWMLLALTCIGSIVLIVFFIQDGTPGENKYGPNPKGV